MNTRFSFIALSIAMAVLSLALFITVVGATTSSVSGIAFGIETDVDRRDGMGSRLLAYQAPNISLDETLSLTEPISIYLPLILQLKYTNIKYSSERAALMALYNSTNGEDWVPYLGWGWGTETPYCEWQGVTCDEDEHVTSLNLNRFGLSGTLPSEIGNLPGLTVLWLSSKGCDDSRCWGEPNRLVGPIPPEIGGLVKMESLDLSSNQLTSIPPEIGNLTYLQELWLNGNQLTSLPTEINGLVKMESFDLSWNQLTSIPPEIGNLASLQELNLSGNPLATLPAEIGNLVNLQILKLGRNQLATLPAEIGNLTSLQVFHLVGTQLTSLPPEIGNLANLQGLDLSENQLTSIPSEIGNLVNLQVFYLWGNHLTSLPPELGNLASLQELWVSYNQLSGFIPAFLSNLGNLSSLNLGRNPDLTCWETKEARDWALSLYVYYGPTCFFPLEIYLPACFRY